MTKDIIGGFSREHSGRGIAYTDLTIEGPDGAMMIDETMRSVVQQLIEQGQNPIIVGIGEEIILYRDIPGIESHIIEIPQQVELDYIRQYEEALAQYEQNKDSNPKLIKPLPPTRGQKNLAYTAEIMSGKRTTDKNVRGVVAGNQTHTGLVLYSLFKQMGKEVDDKKLSSHFIMNHDSHTFLLSDGGVSVDPTSKELADIVYYTILSANHYGMDPSVALLNGGGNNPKIKQAYELAKKMLEDIGITNIDWHVGVSFKKAHDVGVSVIVAPDLNTGNIGYKVAQRIERHENGKELDLGESILYNFDSNFGNISFVYDKYTLLNTPENLEEKAKKLVKIALSSLYRAVEKGVTPRIAFVSYSTQGSKGGKFQLYDVPARAAELMREKVKDLGLDVAIEGDIQFDAACLPEIARKKIKGRPCEFGDNSANIFIFPDTDSGNICCDIAATVGGSEAIGPIVDGCVYAANDLSRGAKVEDIIAMHHITKNMNKKSN